MSGDKDVTTPLKLGVVRDLKALNLILLNKPRSARASKSKEKSRTAFFKGFGRS